MKATKKKITQRRLSPHWKSRIVGHSRVDPRSLKANPLNWRLHGETQTRAMRDALDTLGIIQGVIVNKRTGHIVDGHMRNELAIENDEQLVDVTYVDLSEDEEKLALSIINPMAELATTDPEKLGELLGLVKRDGGPLDDLLMQLEEQATGAIVKHAESSTGTTRKATKPRSVMRMMLENPDVAVIERAIAMTGLMNRGEALLAICRAYMGNDHADRQDQPSPEGSLADQLAQALGGDAGDTGKPRRQRARVAKSVPVNTTGDRVRVRSGKGREPVLTAADLVGLSSES